VNWSALAAIAEMLGAAAVVMSVLYLAAQVRSGTRQAKLDATRELATRISEISLAVATSREMGALLLNGGGAYEGLDEVDRVRFRGLMNALFRGLEQQYFLRIESALDDEAWSAVEQIAKDFSSLPGVQQYLADRGNWYSASFLAFLWSTVEIESPPPSATMADQYRPTSE
jgi:hypothetical protein